jgi:phosphatidylethanolamine-binding protein (PEBP) family uncharacterized protein
MRDLLFLPRCDSRVPGATEKDVERAMQGHILAQGEWVGRCGR